MSVDETSEDVVLNKYTCALLCFFFSEINALLHGLALPAFLYISFSRWGCGAWPGGQWLGLRREGEPPWVEELERRYAQQTVLVLHAVLKRRQGAYSFRK